jgi:ribosome-binding protein aMBF1 (putative translation factor)
MGRIFAHPNLFRRDIYYMYRNFDDLLEEQLKNPEFKKAYEDLELSSQLAEQVILLRQRRGLTQAQLADKIGTKQSGISRLENMTFLPSLAFLSRIAEALDADIEIRFKPKNKPSNPKSSSFDKLL